MSEHPIINGTAGLKRLVKDYQAIDAPPYLASRVAALVAAPGRPARRWWPAAGTLAALLGAVALVAVLTPTPEPEMVATDLPSMSTLSTIQLHKPAGMSPSLASLKSVSAPALPAKPVLSRPADQDTRNDKPKDNDARLERDEENDHVYS